MAPKKQRAGSTPKRGPPVRLPTVSRRLASEPVESPTRRDAPESPIRGRRSAAGNGPPGSPSRRPIDLDPTARRNLRQSLFSSTPARNEAAPKAAAKSSRPSGVSPIRRTDAESPVQPSPNPKSTYRPGPASSKKGKAPAPPPPPPVEDSENSSSGSSFSPVRRESPARRVSPAKRGPAAAKSKSSVQQAQSSKRKSAPKKRKDSFKVPDSVFRKRYRYPERGIDEIKYYQSTTHSLLPKAPFCRVVREITESITHQADLRYKASALGALQAAAEAYLIGFFEDANLLALHAKRVTLMDKDLRLAYKLRGDSKT